jgi:SAM-dependent methyltransferase
MLANTFLKPQGVLVSCDYSQVMVNKLRNNLGSSDYAQVLGNKYALAE